MASAEPSPRERHAAVGIGRRLYIWGGICPIRNQGQTLHSFDVSSLTWEEPQEVNGPESLPDGLHAMAVATDGENAFTFGGMYRTTSDGTCSNQIHQVNPAEATLRELLPVSLGSGDVPRGKSFSGMVHFNQKLVVYGGFCDPGVTDELHVFDLREKKWSVQPTTGEKPPPLASHTFTKVDHHRAVVFGGESADNSKFNGTYVLDMETWHWTKLVSGNQPVARSWHAACCIAGPLTGQEHPLLMVTGGWEGEEALGDVWLLDVDKGVWTEVTLPVALTPRDGLSAVVFGQGPSFRVVVLFGGTDTSDFFMSDTTLLLWELRGGSWQVTRVVKPDELGRPDESLREQMKKLELPPQDHDITPINEATAGRSPVIDVREVEIVKLIGQGGFGAVYEAKWKNKRVAVKVCSGNLLKSFSREIEVLTSLPSHPHVLTFFGIALGSDGISTLIVTELAPNGSLHKYLHVRKVEPSSDLRMGWALQIANGMQHLHKNNIVHRDLKSGNILLASGLLAKICDFGTARTIVEESVTTQKGTTHWMAPEIVGGVEAKINKLCDVFSYGMVLYEIFALRVPYDDIPTNALVGLAVLQGKRPPVPPNLPPFLCPLLQDCWKEEPKQRPEFEAIVLAIQTESYK